MTAHPFSLKKEELVPPEREGQGAGYFKIFKSSE